MADNSGSMLLRAGVLTDTQLRFALEAMRRHGGTLGEHLVLQGSIDEERLCEFYRERLLVPRVGLRELSGIPDRVIGRVPGDMAVEFRVIPLDFDREENLLLGMADPANTHAVDEISFFTGTFVMRAVAAPSAIAWALSHYYGVRTPLSEPRPVTVAPAAPAATSSAPPRRDSTPPLVPPAVAAISATPVPVEVKDQGSGVVIVSRPIAADSAFPVELPPLRRKKAAALIVDDAELPPDTVAQLPTITAPEPTPAPDDARVGLASKAGPDEITAVEGELPPVSGEFPAEPPVLLSLGESEPDTRDADAALAAAIAQLNGATSSDAVAAILVGFLGKLCRRAAFFVVRRGQLIGWTGQGTGVREARLRRVGLTLDRASTFQDVVRTRLPYRGPVADAPSRDFLIAAVSWAPEDMLAVPIAVRERVVGVLYGDERTRALPDEHLVHVARAASISFERAVMAMKVTRSGEA